MAVTTWSFNSGFNGWTFEDISADISTNPCALCSATRSHVIGAIRTTLVLDNLANVTAAGLHTSPTELNAAIVNLDTIEVDYSATSDGFNTQIIATGVYTDATSESNSVTSSTAGTLTLTLTQSKTLDYITVQDARSTGGSGSGSTNTRDIEEIRLTTATALMPTPGKLRTPQEFIEDQGAGAAGGAGGGAGGNIADISASGTYVYLASFDNLGFPIIIKIASALNADGTIVFEPGAGGRIGVQCGDLDNDVVWVAGQFDSTDTVEKTEDGGSSFTVKDDGTFGAIRSFQVGPNNDDRVIIYDGDNNDIIETINSGDTWKTINGSVLQLVNSIARFDKNLEEIVIGNQAGVNDNINYSPNTGQDLEDYSTGFPTQDVTKVIVN